MWSIPLAQKIKTVNSFWNIHWPMAKSVSTSYRLQTLAFKVGSTCRLNWLRRMTASKANQITIRAKIFISVRDTLWKITLSSKCETKIGTFSVLIGAILHINCRRFIITSADLNDYRYMQENPELFSQEAIESVRDYLISTNCLSPNEAAISSS